MESIVTFNVGGKLMATSRSTIMKYPGTMLANCISEDSPIPWIKDNNGHFFIDRSPEEFAHVLSFYRDGKVPEDMRICLYWGLVEDSTIQSMACWVDAARDMALSRIDEAVKGRSLAKFVKTLLFSGEFPSSAVSRQIFAPRFMEDGTTLMVEKFMKVWIESLDESQMKTFRRLYKLDKIPLMGDESVFQHWRRVQMASELTNYERTAIKCILRRIGCRAVKWYRTNNGCKYCDKTHRAKGHPIVTYVDTANDNVHRIPMLCPKQMDSMVKITPNRGGVLILPCPKDARCQTGWILSFRFVRSRDYDVLCSY